MVHVELGSYSSNSRVLYTTNLSELALRERGGMGVQGKGDSSIRQML